MPREGRHILLGPAVNIHRSPLCGRNFEYMGEDPFLASTMVVPLIEGIQSQQVLATIKHFACNNQEWDRHNVSSEVDERTLQEIYLPAFKAAVQKAKAGCVMCAYNLVNGVHCTENDYLLDKILKQEWGFDGIIMSDWGVHSQRSRGGKCRARPGNAGPGKLMNRDNLEACHQGRHGEGIDHRRKVRRILHTIIAAGFLDRPQTDSKHTSGRPERRPGSAQGRAGITGPSQE